MVGGAVVGAGLRLGFLLLRVMFRGSKRKVTATLERMWFASPVGAPDHHHAYALFDSKGKRIKLKLKPRQVKPFWRDSAEGDVGHLTYAGKTMIAWKAVSQEQPVRTRTGIKVFVSYAHEESETAAYIAQVLQAHGLDAWLDTSQLRTGSKLKKEIVRQIESARFFVPLLSPDYLASPWCIKEFEVAAGKRVAFVPIKITEKPLVMPPHLKKIYEDELHEPVYLDIAHRDPTAKLKELAEQMISDT